MRIKKIAIITILALTGLVAIVGAQASLDQCNSNRVCMWGNNDFKWLIGERAPGGGLVNLSGDRNERDGLVGKPNCDRRRGLRNLQRPRRLPDFRENF